MTQMTRVVVLACGLSLAASHTALAQGEELLGRWFLNVNAGLQAPGRNLSEAGSFPLYDENLTIEGTRKISSALVIDVAGGVHFSESLAFGIGYSRMSSGSDVVVAARVPHPLFVDRPRAAAANISGLDHSEQAIHLMAFWRFHLLEGVDAKVGAGPSFFRVRETAATSVTATESGAPFEQVAIAFATGSHVENAVGFNVVGDVTYLITERLGAGIMLRYTAASVDMPVGGNTRDTNVGGLQFGGGLRLRF